MDLKNIIESQKKIINDNNLEQKFNEDNLLSNHSENDIEIDLEEMIYDDEMDDLNPGENEDDDEINDLYQEMMEKNNEIKKSSKNEMLPEITQKRDKSLLSKNQIKLSQERLQGGGNNEGVSFADYDDDSPKNQLKKDKKKKIQQNIQRQ
jgi:hypothetical protein